MARRLRVAVITLVSTVCTAILVLASVTAAYPGPGVLAAARTSRTAQMFAAEAKYVPAGVTTTADVLYDTGSSDAYSRAETLDVLTPTTAVTAGEQLPTVVWIHGGAWIGGSAGEMRSHLAIVAHGGYTVVGVNYTLAPARHYPTPLRQIMAALAYIQTNAERLHVDPDRIILAGDSAGAQLAAQTAELITDPTYAAEVGVTSTLAAERLRGVVLYCGVFDWTLKGVHGTYRSFLQKSLLTYTGSRHPGRDARTKTGSVVDHVSSSFPATFITAGNGDPVLPLSVAMQDALEAKHVSVDSLYFPASTKPALPHEYEFFLGTKAARTALSRMFTFLSAHTAPTE